MVFMKKFLFGLSAFLFLQVGFISANPGDTIFVQTFTYGSPQDAWFVFPSDTIRFEKILMQYKLRCTTSNNPACGEWDYLTYTYTPTWQYFIEHTDTVSLTASTIGTGVTHSSLPFGASNQTSRSQYLWKASEMTSAGLTPGNITGLRFYLQTLGGALNNLTIRFAATSQDSLTPGTLVNAGFTNVYQHNTQFLSTGWNGLQLTNPYNWNGTSNIIIDITYDNDITSTNNILLADNTPFSSALSNTDADRVASFDSYGYVEIPLNNEVAAIDSFITVSLWCYGNPALMPMNSTAFEATDSLGNRLLNSHLPWSDNNVYWDAGNESNAYDRINKLATVPEIEGNWNYWVFTKNLAQEKKYLTTTGNG